jgi:hypothetical protein
MTKQANPLHGVARTLAALRSRGMAKSRRRLELATLPRIGGMASIPSRAKDLARVLERIVPQVERLHLFLHGYDAIPPEARHARIVPVLAPKSHPYRASGKFYGLKQESAPCLYVTFDDDILYPPTYVERLAQGLIRHEGNAVVGFHAQKYLPPYQSYLRDTRNYYFARRQLFERRVDELGTGTVAFVSSRLKFDPPSWKYGDIDDINLAIEAERAGLPRICLPRPRHYMRQIWGQTESLWQTVQADESRTVEMMRELLALMGRLPADQLTCP